MKTAHVFLLAATSPPARLFESMIAGRALHGYALSLAPDAGELSLRVERGAAAGIVVDVRVGDATIAIVADALARAPARPAVLVFADPTVPDEVGSLDRALAQLGPRAVPVLSRSADVALAQLQGALQFVELEWELSKARARIELAEKQIGFGSFERDLASGVSAWSPQMMSLFGLSRDADPIKRDTVIGSMPKDHHARVWAEIGAAEREGGSFGCDLPLHLPGRPPIHVRLRGTVLRASDGTPATTLGLCFDVTDQVRLARRVQDVIAAAPIGIAIVGPTGIIEDANPAFEAGFGYPDGALRDASISAVVVDPETDGHDAREGPLSRGVASMDRISTGGRRGLLGRRQDGSLFAIEVARAPFEDGGREATIVAVVDVSARVALEERLEAANAEVRAIIDSLPARVSSWDAKGRNRFVNRAFEQSLGITVADACGRHASDVLGEEQYEASRPSMEAAMRGEEGRLELAVETSTGRRDYVVSFVPVLVGGTPSGLVVHAADVTAIKDVERGRALAEARLRAVTDSAPIGIVLTDTAGRRLYSNPAALAMLGLSLEEMLGEGWFQSTHPEDRERVAQTYGAALRGAPTFESRHRLLRRDGTIARVHVRGAEFRVGDERLGFVVCADDVTAQHEADELGARLFAVLNETPDLVVIRDLAGAIVFMNRAARRLLGFPENGLLAVREAEVEWRRVRPSEEDGSRRSRLTEQALRDGMAFGEAVLHVRGASIEVSKVVIAHRDDEGTPTHVTSIARDVTEQNRHQRELEALKEAAERANRAKSQFLANMSHEIRTPMNAILGMGELLVGSDLNPKQKAYVGTFQTAADHLMHILNDILDVAKVESGKLELEAAPFSLRDLIEQTAEFMRVQRKAGSVEITCRLDPALPPTLLGDVARLRQVLVNLIGNAIKFTPAGEIVISARTTDVPEEYEVSVSDSGIGIPQARLEAIFESFSQADNSMTRRFGGTGLGLTISRHLVERMGGKLRVASEVGKGTTFNFTIALLPVGSGLAAAPQKRGTTANETRAGTEGGVLSVPLEILVAEDVPANRDLLDAHLEKCPIRLHFAYDGVAAVELFRERPFDLVLMDLQMPRMDGLEAARQIRAIERERGGTRTPMVAMTAHVLRDDVERCLAAGCDGHLPKPISGTALLNTIATFAPARPLARSP